MNRRVVKALEETRKLLEQDDDVRSKVMAFFKENPYPDDSAVHELADQLGIDAHELEGVIYGLLSDAMAGKLEGL